MATLVTGLGYIGAALLERLVTLGHQTDRLVVLENFYCTSRADVAAALPRPVCLVEGDVAEARDVARAFDALGPSAERPHMVYHLAAQPSASVAWREPALTERTNLVGARVLLETARERGAQVVFGGSFRVYGDVGPGSLVDEHTPYGRVADLSHLSKLYTEQLARMLGLPFASVRLGVAYGRSPIMKTTPAFMTVPNLFCQRAVRGEPLAVHSDAPLAFIHVRDAAQALARAAELLRRTPRGAAWQVINAAPEVATVGQVALTVRRLMQARGVAVEISGSTASEATFGVRSALEAAGFTPQHTLADGLDDVLEFFCAR